VAHKGTGGPRNAKGNGKAKLVEWKMHAYAQMLWPITLFHLFSIFFRALFVHPQFSGGGIT